MCVRMIIIKQRGHEDGRKWRDMEGMKGGGEMVKTPSTSVNLKRSFQEIQKFAN